MKKVYFFLLLVLLSCSTGLNKGRLKPYQTSSSYKSNYDNIWANVVEYFAINGFIITELDKSKGVISTDYVLPSLAFDTLTNCSGLQEGAVFNNNMIDFHVNVTKEEDSVIKIIATTKYIINYELMDDKGTNKHEFFCEGNGVFEKKFFDFMDRKNK